MFGKIQFDDDLTPKQFRDQLAEYSQNMREFVEADVQGFSPNAKARKKRIEQALADDGYWFFARTYFPHYIRDQDKVSPSVFQEWLAQNFQETVTNPESVDWAIAAPRGEAKSTLMLIAALWFTARGDKRYMLYVMDSYAQAAGIVESYKVELTSNPRLKMDFPGIFGQGKIWRDGECITANDIKVQALGAAQKVRGLKHKAWRPDAVFLDDIENDENVRSPAQRDKLEDWLNKAIENLGEAGEKLDKFYVGTVLHFDSVLARTLKNPSWRRATFQSIIEWPTHLDLWEQWEELLRNEGMAAADAFYAANDNQMNEGAKVSWPDKRPLIYLMKLRVKIGQKAFNSEQQNMPTDDNASFAKITYWVQPMAAPILFGACDPSLGKVGRKGDPSAIGIGAFDRNKVEMDILEASIKRRTPTMIIQHMLDFQRKYNCMMWFLEAVQFQEFFRSQAITDAGREFVNLPARPVIPSTDKELRIESLSIHVADGRLRMHSSQKTLIDQFQQFPNADHDDGPDMVEMLWSGAIENIGRLDGWAVAGSRVHIPQTGAGMGGSVGAQGGIINKLGGL